jgi:hypothetical protein
MPVTTAVCAVSRLFLANNGRSADRRGQLLVGNLQAAADGFKNS